MKGSVRIATLCLLLAGSAVAASPADDIVRASGVRAGLCVHVGIGDGSLTAELSQGGRFLVHGLDPDAKTIEAARKTIMEKRVYGQVSVERCDLAALPYAENLVNLMVVERADGLNMAEVMRVLVPNGIVMMKGAGSSTLEKEGFEAAVQAPGLPGWARGRKPRPAEMDEWGQYLHDPGQTRVSEDRLVVI